MTPRRRIAVAIELDLPDGWDADALSVRSLFLASPDGRTLGAVGAVASPQPNPEEARICRSEIHPDPAAVFADDELREWPAEVSS